MAASPRRLAPSPATAISATTGLDQRNSARSISVLSGFEEMQIIAWLHLLRSIKSSNESRPNDGHLSQHQLRALQRLSDLPKEDLEAWFAQRRAQSAANIQADIHGSSNINPGLSPSSSLLGLWGSTPRDVVSSHEYSSPENDPVPDSDQSQPISPRTGATSHLPTPSGHIYWSTADETPQHFTTFDGFRRHENERERDYKLVPENLTEVSAQGLLCVFCHVQDPDTKHFETHNALSFLEEHRPLITRSRKENFRRLLRTHNVPEDHIDRLVRKWHFTNAKQAYSCGLCIKLCSTLLERTNHLAHKHYERGESRAKWDVNYLIMGLLCQADIKEEFQRQFRIDPTTPTSGLTWTTPSAWTLRDRLESREESPEILAQAANAAANRSLSIFNIDVASTTDDDDMQNEALSASSAPPTMDNSIGPWNFASTRVPSRHGSTRRVPRRRQIIDPQLNQAETPPLPLGVWNPFPDETDSTGLVNPMHDPHMSHQIASIRNQNLFEEQDIHQPLKRSASHGDDLRTPGLGIYTPHSFPESSFTNQDLEPSNAFWTPPVWSQEQQLWPVPGYEENPRATTRDSSMGYSTLKRKHSPSTAGASSSKSYIMSPPDDYPPPNHHRTDYEHE